MSHELTQKQKERRMSLIQSLFVAVMVGGPVGFGSLLIAEASGSRSASGGAGAGIIAGAVMLCLYARRPPRVTPAPPRPKSRVSASDYVAVDPKDAAGKDWSWWLIVIALSIGWALLQVLRFFVPLSIIAIIWALHPSAGGWMVLFAAGLSIAVMALVEFGVEFPLCRLWGLPFPATTRPREEYCSVPQDQSRQV